MFSSGLRIHLKYYIRYIQYIYIYIHVAKKKKTISGPIFHNMFDLQKSWTVLVLEGDELDVPKFLEMLFHLAPSHLERQQFLTAVSKKIRDIYIYNMIFHTLFLYTI